MHTQGGLQFGGAADGICCGSLRDKAAWTFCKLLRAWYVLLSKSCISTKRALSSFSTPAAAENPNAMLPGTFWYQSTKTPDLFPKLGVRKFFSLICPIECTLNILPCSCFHIKKQMEKRSDKSSCFSLADGRLIRTSGVLQAVQPVQSSPGETLVPGCSMLGPALLPHLPPECHASPWMQDVEGGLPVVLSTDGAPWTPTRPMPPPCCSHSVPYCG